MSDDDFDSPSVTPVGPGTYGRFMAIRAFDVWVHERDIRVPLWLSGDDGGAAAELALDEVHGSLGFIVGKKIGLAEGKGIAIELTGPVQRTLLAKVDGRAARVDELPNPDITLTTDSLTFMLLACGRIDPEGPIADGRITWSGDADLGAWIARFQPDAVLTGHVHEPPFKPAGAWADRLGPSWVFNAGRQIGPVPAHIEIDFGAGRATWHSMMGSESLALDAAAAPPRSVF